MKYRNLFEKATAASLKRRKVKFEYEKERIAYVISGHYIPDFVITTRTGKVYIECKGYLRSEDKRKLVSVKRCNPQLDVRILFYSKRKSYIRWAERNGFRWAVEKIPTEWIEGL